MRCQGGLNSAPKIDMMKDFLALAMSCATPFGVAYVKPLPMKGIKPNDDAWQTRPLIRARRLMQLKKHLTAPHWIICRHSWFSCYCHSLTSALLGATQFGCFGLKFAAQSKCLLQLILASQWSAGSHGEAVQAASWGNKAFFWCQRFNPNLDCKLYLHPDCGVGG